MEALQTKKIRLYLDTSVWNFPFADDAPEKQSITVSFLNNLPQSPYEIYISSVVFEEIDVAPQEKRQRLHDLIRFHAPKDIPLSDEIRELAREYIRQGAIPAAMPEDALHVACAAVEELDALISWNMRHIANLRRQAKVQAVNSLKGYNKPLLLLTPMEVSEYE